MTSEMQNMTKSSFDLNVKTNVHCWWDTAPEKKSDTIYSVPSTPCFNMPDTVIQKVKLSVGQ